jgi:UDP-N-acetylglucosamine--N-acetylmuramyl-(pentapeptide) pyrophosphoryl-undecaprenol N-acetylglucosamine transferase
MTATRTVLFAGGGTGGHIYPNLAVLDELRRISAPQCAWQARFLISDRPLDAQILDGLDVSVTALPVRPLPRNVLQWAGFLRCWRRSRATMQRLLREDPVAAVVATGGFVSGPVVVAARRAGAEVALVNLDAVPGRANRALVRHCTKTFSVYDVPQWPDHERIGLPLRRSARATIDAAQARTVLGLTPDVPTLLVMGGSQGAQSINATMRALVAGRGAAVDLLRRWQIIHISGPRPGAAAQVQQAYRNAGMAAHVLGFCDQVGRAWAAATLAVSRAGAGSVAEAWAAAVPAIFMPYPFHRDQHQRLNALPLCAAAGAVIAEDRIEPGRNARTLEPLLEQLLADEGRLRQMSDALRATWPGDGATPVARWLADKLAGGDPTGV